MRAIRKYSIGVDYGSLSARALMIDIDSGEEIATSIYEYPHTIMERSLPTGEKLGIDWALQHPKDYTEGLINTIKGVINTAGIDPENVIGVGIDFTSCTILPIKNDGTPLCMLEEFEKEPHAYVKLWKHHAAQYCADHLNETAEKMGEKWLHLYGGKISSEWLVPKVMQIAEEAPHIYDASDKFIEAGDWIVWQLCGVEARSACNAGYKALWHHETGYPSKEFFKALHPKLENVVEEKLSTDIKSLGDCAGYLTAEMAKKTGLKEGTAIGVGIIDAHASVPACKIDGPGKMLMILGTSTCHMLLSKEEKAVPGSAGIVKDGILPGFFGYESGQSCVGDHFSWFVDNCVPQIYNETAKAEGIGIHQYLTKKADALRVGESGLLALDWWNGVRSTLMDFDLTGLMLGMTLQTKPEEVYRALIEATAYGTRQIIEAYEIAGVVVDELYGAGGIAVKNPMLMQIYADVCNKEIKISGSDQSGALGAAILGIVAAGEKISGYKGVSEVAAKLGKLEDAVYKPIQENVRVYEVLFREYQKLYEYFGTGGNDVMKKLKAMK